MAIHSILKIPDHRKPRETRKSSLPFTLTALVLNVMSCMLFEVVLLQVKQEQGKSKVRGGTEYLMFIFLMYKKTEYIKHPFPKYFPIQQINECLLSIYAY